MTNLVAPGKNLGYSNIYLDFLAESKSARNFYLEHDIGNVSTKLDKINYNREKLTEILEKQNRQYNASGKTFQNIQKLKDPKCLAVFSGQQAVLFGGPMLIMIKAVTLVKTAEQYSKELGRPVIPIFWIAGDDHDFEEANHTVILNRQSEEVRVSYDAPPERDVPVAETTFANHDMLTDATSLLKDSLGETDFTGRLYELIDDSYRPGETLVTAFGKLLAGLTGELGLVFFCPGDVVVKNHAADFFKAIVDKQDQLHEVVSSTNKDILDRGYHLQVEKADNATHLFYNCNGRKPVLRNGNNYSVEGKTLTQQELLQRIESEPEKFSPDVMTRPVFQSYLFPVVSQRGGPAEIAYLAQINPIFQLFDLPVPVHRSRPSATFIEKRAEQLMAEYDISFEDLTGDIEQVINRVLSKSFPEDLEKEFETLRKNIEQEFDTFKKDSLKFDPALEQFAQQSFGKIDYTIKNFQAKVFSAHKKKSKDVRDRIYRLWHALFTGRGLQERTLNINYFVSKYGFDFIRFMYDHIDVNEKSHQLISLSEFKR